MTSRASYDSPSCRHQREPELLACVQTHPLRKTVRNARMRRTTEVTHTGTKKGKHLRASKSIRGLPPSQQKGALAQACYWHSTSSPQFTLRLSRGTAETRKTNFFGNNNVMRRLCTTLIPFQTRQQNICCATENPTAATYPELLAVWAHTDRCDRCGCRS